MASSTQSGSTGRWDGEQKVFINPLADRALMLCIPFLLVSAYILFIFAYLPYEQFLLLGGVMLAYFVPPAGKESMIPLGIALGIPWYLVAISIALLDALSGLFMAWNFDLALKIPIVGGWIEKFMHHGRAFVCERPWLEELYFAGLVIFVMVPLQGSGGVGGSIVGRVLGMSKIEVVAAITLGAFIGSFAVAIGAQYIINLLKENLILGLLLASGVIIAGIAIAVCTSRARKKRREVCSVYEDGEDQ
jgi:Predicted membrane protein